MQLTLEMLKSLLHLMFRDSTCQFYIYKENDINNFSVHVVNRTSLNGLSDKMHYIPSIVFVSMLAMLIALCLAADSSSISMEIWYELNLLFLISVSVVVPCKWNTEELDHTFQQPINNIYCINIVVIMKSALCNVLCFSLNASVLVRISYFFIEELSGNFVQWYK